MQKSKNTNTNPNVTLNLFSWHQVGVDWSTKTIKKYLLKEIYMYCLVNIHVLEIGLWRFLVKFSIVIQTYVAKLSILSWQLK